MRRIGYLASLSMLLAWPLAGLAQSEEPRPAEDESQVLAESFAQLVFGFCATLTSQEGTPKTDSIPSSLKLRGPMPLSEVGKLSEPLQSRLKAKPESPVLGAVPAASRVGQLHLAYATVDGSECLAMAQDMPDAVAQIAARVDADPQFRLKVQSDKRRIYIGNLTGSERSIMVGVPTTSQPSMMAEVSVSRVTGDPVIFPSTEDIKAWSSAVLHTCLKSAQQKTQISVADFGGFMMESTNKLGTSIVSPPQYPSAVLFGAVKRQLGCNVTLSAGVEENATVVEVLREELAKLGAKQSAGKKGDEFVIARVRGETKAGARLTLSEIFPGLFSVVILSD